VSQRPSSVAALLRELVAIESPSGSEAACADHVVELLRSGGVDVERVGDSVLARVDLCGAGAGPGLLLNSHLDTVPVGEGWTVPPTGNDWRDGRLYGRGSNDAKASAAAMIWTVLRLAGTGETPGGRGTVFLALTACEETTNAGMGAVLERLAREAPGASVDAGVAGVVHGAVTGEPTGLQVVRAQSGLAVLEAVWSGRSCHAAHVARVAHHNALLAAARELAAIDSHLVVGQPHPLIGISTIAPTVLQAGHRHNVIPDRAELLLDARLAPPASADDAAAVVRRALPGAQVRVRSARLGPVETAADHPLVRAAVAAADREVAVGSNTLSDMALLRGIPAVKCGPGETARSHTPDEYVQQDELEAGARFYERFATSALEALAAQGLAR
jgi:acetylornithine deacetylase